MAHHGYSCPIARHCGGCEWLSLPYPVQLERKQALVEELLGGMCHHDGGTLEQIRGMKKPLHYRCKAATPFAPGKQGQIQSGFFARGTHHIIACDSCLVEDPRARPILTNTARAAAYLHLPAYDEDSGEGLLRHAVVRCGWATDEVLLTIVTNGETIPRERKLIRDLRHRSPQITSIVQNINTRRTNAILGKKNRTLWGPGVMHDRLLGCAFEIGPTSFYQTNPAQTEVLYRLAIEGVAGKPLALTPANPAAPSASASAAKSPAPLRVLDAYCGTGTIGLCLARHLSSAEVTGVEQVPDAIECARRNARANGLEERARFVAADATAWMAHLDSSSEEARFDAVILDPPRAGSTEAFLKGVCRLNPERVVYVSCNVETQARDLKVLRAGGYRLCSVAPVDMFPHTRHVETVVTLEKR